MTNDEINVILDNEDSITAHTTTNMVNVYFTFNIPYQILGSSVKGFNSGYYQNSSISSICRVLVSKTSANLTIAYLNSQDKKSTSTTTIYYR